MKKFLVAAVVLATVFAFAACGGSKKSKPEIETDEDQVETEDSDIDGESVVPDGGDDEGGNDSDSNQPGGNDDTPVVPDNDTPDETDPEAIKLFNILPSTFAVSAMLSFFPIWDADGSR